MVGRSESSLDMNPAREEILQRIRNAAGLAGVGGDGLFEPGYLQTGALSHAELLATFNDRLHDYGAGVYLCGGDEVAVTIGLALHARDKRRLLMPESIAPHWLPSGFEFVPDRGLSHEELDRCEGALTGCTAAIAMTGSILLTHRKHEGRRALTLIPDYHLCIVFAEQIVETVPEGIRELAAFSRYPITTIAGPSATADIEMIRVKGVHGPRTLDVVLVS
jgi:L-lactate dehydrogenase complex protein LldG